MVVEFHNNSGEIYYIFTFKGFFDTLWDLLIEERQKLGIFRGTFYDQNIDSVFLQTIFLS